MSILMAAWNRSLEQLHNYSKVTVTVVRPVLLIFHPGLLSGDHRENH